MASESVKRILDAEAEADRKTMDARKRADEIVTQAQRNGAVAVQKKLSKYAENAEKECSEKLDELRDRSTKNSDKAVSAIISEFFG